MGNGGYIGRRSYLTLSLIKCQDTNVQLLNEPQKDY